MQNFYYLIKNKNVDLYLNYLDVLIEDKYLARRFSTYQEAEDYIKVLQVINDDYYANLTITLELMEV